ncbi:MAG: NAD-dependent epimerase/dehydratase family protein [Anaerolineales bacterium]
MTLGIREPLSSGLATLVTGGAGFIGSNLVRHLLRTLPSARVITLDKLTYAGQRRNFEGLADPDRHEFVHGDIGTEKGAR